MKACLFRRWLSFQTANWPFFSGRRPQNATPTTEWLRRLLADRVVWRTRNFRARLGDLFVFANRQRDHLGAGRFGVSVSR